MGISLSQAAEWRLADIIARHGLHMTGQVPVPIHQVARNEGWIIEQSPGLAPYFGYSVIAPYALTMRINADMPSEQQRFTVAHELGHWVSGDGFGIHRCQPNLKAVTLEWLRSERRALEQRASLVAARLLVPDWSFQECRSEEEVARLCEVPIGLVREAATDLRRRCKRRDCRRCPLSRYQFATVASFIATGAAIVAEFGTGFQDMMHGIGVISGGF